MNAHAPLRLNAARACAWALLIAGWVGIGSFAMTLAPGVTAGFALVAVWLLALGAAATIATGGPWGSLARAAAACRAARASRAGSSSAAACVEAEAAYCASSGSTTGRGASAPLPNDDTASRKPCTA